VPNMLYRLGHRVQVSHAIIDYCYFVHWSVQLRNFVSVNC
jgi:hypothetical protein